MHARYSKVHEINKNISSKCFLEETAHVESEQNIANLATRMDGSLAAIGPGSLWQEGPAWLKQPRHSWPYKRDLIRSLFPQEACKALIRILACSVTVLTVNIIQYVLDTSLRLSEAERRLSKIQLSINSICAVRQDPEPRLESNRLLLLTAESHLV